MSRIFKTLIPILSLLVIAYGVTSFYGKIINQNKKKLSLEAVLNDYPVFEDGDIIFQTSLSNQSLAIQKATNSVYSHVGIIFSIKNKNYVLEAVQPVKYTPLYDWIRRGKNNSFIVKRLKNSGELLTSEKLKNMKAYGKEMIGKDYDLHFDWSEDKMYCSELVWKIYKRGTGIEIGNLQQLQDLNLEDKIVSTKLTERYGKNIPMEAKVITPVEILNSDLLHTVN